MGYVKEVASNQRPSNASGTTSHSFVLSAAPIAGNTLIFHYAGNVALTSITDTAGNTWIKAKAESGSPETEQWYCQQDVRALTTSDSITYNAATNIFGVAIKVAEHSGILEPSPIDGTGLAIWTTASTTRQAGTANTVNANDEIIATFGINMNETSFLAGSGYSTGTTPYINNSNNTRSVAAEFKQTSAAGSYSPTATGGASSIGSGVVVAYKLSSTGTIVPTTNVMAVSTAIGTVTRKSKISGVVNATSTVGGTIQLPGEAVIPSTYGVGVFGQAVYGGSGAPPPTGIVGNVFATSVVSGGISRLGGTSGGIYTPPYSPPTPPPSPAPGTIGPFANAVYDLLNLDELSK
jgi:hypothetical protein